MTLKSVIIDQKRLDFHRDTLSMNRLKNITASSIIIMSITFTHSYKTKVTRGKQEIFFSLK